MAVIDGHDIFSFHIDVGTNCQLFPAPVGWVDLENLVLATVVHDLPLAHSGGVLFWVVIWVVGGWERA